MLEFRPQYNCSEQFVDDSKVYKEKKNIYEITKSAADSEK